MSLKFWIRDLLGKSLCLISMNYLDKIRLCQFKRGIYASISRILVQRVIRYRRVDSNIISFSPPDDSTHIKYFNDGSFISKQIFWRGMRGYEYFEAKLWGFLCANSKIVVEMGANIGYFTVIGASASKDIRYTAIEANPNIVELLKSNISLNSLENVDLIAAAVVDQTKGQPLEMFIPIVENNECAPTGSYLEGGEIDSRPSNSSIKVDVVQANKVIGRADLIKLDIEGQEYSVLKSISHEIFNLRPIIMLEVLKNTPKLRDLILKLTTEHNYEIFAIGKDQLHKISDREIKTINLQETYHSRDALIIPAEKVSVVSSYGG